MLALQPCLTGGFVYSRYEPICVLTQVCVFKNRLDRSPGAFSGACLKIYTNIKKSPLKMLPSASLRSGLLLKKNNIYVTQKNCGGGLHLLHDYFLTITITSYYVFKNNKSN